MTRRHRCTHDTRFPHYTDCRVDLLDPDNARRTVRDAEDRLAEAKRARWALVPLPLAVILTYVALLVDHGLGLLLTFPLGVAGLVGVWWWPDQPRVPAARRALEDAQEEWAEVMLRQEGGTG